MTKIILFCIVAIFLVSCGKDKAEQMLYDYQQKKVKELNFDLDDLDFKIKKIEKIADITSTDSAKHLKQELAEYWTTNPKQSLVDTLSFERVKRVLNESISDKDTLYKLYQELVLTAIRLGKYSLEVKYKRERDEALEEMFTQKETLAEIVALEKYYNEIQKQPDSILTTKYKAVYSLKNPMLSNVKQTFDKIFFTNANQTKFIREEAIKEK